MRIANPIALRPATMRDARSLHALISANQEEGRLLPRALGELKLRAGRFIVATRGRQIVGCAELAPLSARVAEVRSLAVSRAIRGRSVGTMLVNELRGRARREGFEKLCAFTHAPGYFSQMGFSIVPHTWLLEKVTTDCVNCPRFRRCGQYAMVVALDWIRDRQRDPAEDLDLPAATLPAAVARHA